MVKTKTPEEIQKMKTAGQNMLRTHINNNGFSIVRAFIGHGIGGKMHKKPQTPSFGDANSSPELKVGMTLTVEPMLNNRYL